MEPTQGVVLSQKIILIDFYSINPSS